MRTKLLTLTLALILLPNVHAADAPEENAVSDLRAAASNQRIDLSWTAPPNVTAGRSVVGYEVYVFEAGLLLRTANTSAPEHSFFLTNGRTYAFQVEALLDDGTRGPRSHPVAATPALERDLEYLAAGLIVTWLAIFGYVVWMVRREADLDRKLEQLLAHRGGRAP